MRDFGPTRVVTAATKARAMKDAVMAALKWIDYDIWKEFVAGEDREGLDRAVKAAVEVYDERMSARRIRVPSRSTV